MAVISLALILNIWVISNCLPLNILVTSILALLCAHFFSDRSRSGVARIMYVCIFKASPFWQVLLFTLPTAKDVPVSLYSGEHKLLHSFLSFPFSWEFLRNFKNQGTWSVLLPLQSSLVETMVFLFFLGRLVP